MISDYFKQEGAEAVDADGKVSQKLASVGELISKKYERSQLLIEGHYTKSSTSALSRAGSCWADDRRQSQACAIDGCDVAQVTKSSNRESRYSNIGVIFVEL